MGYTYRKLLHVKEWETYSIQIVIKRELGQLYYCMIQYIEIAGMTHTSPSPREAETGRPRVEGQSDLNKTQNLP